MTVATDRSDEDRRHGNSIRDTAETEWPRWKSLDPRVAGPEALPNGARAFRNPTRVLVIEPDPEMRTALRAFLDVEPDMEIAGEASSAKEAFETLARIAPDVVLIEAEMPLMSGISLVQAYGVDRFPPAVFVIGNERDAADVFRIQAVDCIVKPFTHQQFRTTLERVRSHLRREADERSVRRIPVDRHDTAADAPRFPKRLWTRTRGQSRGQVLILNVDDIEWIEAQARYSCAHTRTGEHRILESISQLEARLDPSRFARVHRSALVNLDRVVEVVSTRNTRLLVLQNGTRVPLSRSRRRRLFQLAGDRS